MNRYPTHGYFRRFYGMPWFRYWTGFGWFGNLVMAVILIGAVVLAVSNTRI